MKHNCLPIGCLGRLWAAQTSQPAYRLPGLTAGPNTQSGCPNTIGGIQQPTWAMAMPALGGLGRPPYE